MKYVKWVGLTVLYVAIGYYSHQRWGVPGVLGALALAWAVATWMHRKA